MPKDRTILRRCLVGVVLFAMTSCTIGSGDGTPFGLNVAWFGQLYPWYCVPASIQMWAFYDHNRVSQNLIAQTLGTVPPDGTPATNVAPGVRQYTATSDPFLEDAFFSNQAQFFSQQITSINNGRPLIAIFNQQHVVVVSGGAYHFDSSTGWNVWDTAAYQDPASGPLELPGGVWMDNITAMVIGASATAEAADYLNEYGDSVRVRGSNFRVPPRN
jgi:hypothetical protein